jgi:hypothetical protein
VADVVDEALAGDGAALLARPLLVLAGALPEAAQGEALERIRQAAWMLDEPDERLRALRLLVEAGSHASAQRRYELWQRALHHGATRTRADLLADLAELAGVYGSAGAAEAVQAIKHAAQWWP